MTKALSRSFCALFAIFLCIFTHQQGVLSQTWDNYYRIEAIFTRFANPQGIIRNGKRCDVFTACDPMLYAYVDVDKPTETYPGSAQSLTDFQLFLEESGKNNVDLNSKIVKNICGRRLPSRVNVRVEAYDYDYFTKNDLIDKFDCAFPFDATSRDVMQWSETMECAAMYNPGSVRLSYRWRIFPINSGECSTHNVLQAVPEPAWYKRILSPPYTTTQSNTTSTQSTMPTTENTQTITAEPVSGFTSNSWEREVKNTPVHFTAAAENVTREDEYVDSEISTYSDGKDESYKWDPK